MSGGETKRWKINKERIRGFISKLKNLLPEEASLPVITQGKNDLFYISIIHFFLAASHKWQAVMTRMVY